MRRQYPNEVGQSITRWNSIGLAPPREYLAKFGGPLSIDQFRQSSNNQSHCRILQLDPITIAPSHQQQQQQQQQQPNDFHVNNTRAIGHLQSTRLTSNVVYQMIEQQQPQQSPSTATATVASAPTTSTNIAYVRRSRLNTINKSPAVKTTSASSAIVDLNRAPKRVKDHQPKETLKAYRKKRDHPMFDAVNNNNSETVANVTAAAAATATITTTTDTDTVEPIISLLKKPKSRTSLMDSKMATTTTTTTTTGTNLVDDLF